MNEHFEYAGKIEDVSPEDVDRQQAEVLRHPMPGIVTLAFQHDTGGTVTYEYPELIAVCPMTGIPDIYTLRVIYVPQDKIPELKSLRMYLLAYRNLPILHEHLICRIFDDFTDTVAPRCLRVELDVAVRGGIHTTAVKESE